MLQRVSRDDMSMDCCTPSPAPHRDSSMLQRASCEATSMDCRTPSPPRRSRSSGQRQPNVKQSRASKLTLLQAIAANSVQGIVEAVDEDPLVFARAEQPI